MMTKAQTLFFVGQRQIGNQWLFSWRILCPILFLLLGIALKTASSTECGRPMVHQRVVGGKDTYLGKAPWMCSLFFKDTHVCGASVISRNWVVTAAHCVITRNPIYLSVTLGTLNLTGPSSTGVSIKVKTVIPHQMYSGDGSSGDIALIELKTPINFTSNILPICLPSPHHHFPDGMMCSLTGWGWTAENVELTEPYTLQHVDLPLINSPACSDMFKAIFGKYYPGIKSNMICAGYVNGTKDGCVGDSGGPLACQHGSIWFLVGIVSWGIGCATPGFPGVYTMVSNFTSWIISKSDLNETLTTEIIQDSTTAEMDTFSTSTPTTTTTESFTSTQQTTIPTTTSTTTTTMTTKITTTSTTNMTTTSTTTLTTNMTTSSGANLRSSKTMRLLIISSIIIKIYDIL